VDAHAAAGARRELTDRGLLLALGVAVSAGCYQPRPLDARAVMDEVARAPAGQPPGVTRPALTPPSGLSEEAAVALALRGNPDLRIARHQRGIAEGEVVTAGELANPTVGFDTIHLEDWGKEVGWAITLGWTPPQPGVYSAGKAAARANAEAVDADIAEREWQVASAVRGAHAQLIAIAEKQELVVKELDARRRIVELVRKRVAGGASTKLDLSVAELAVSEVERARDDLAADEIAAATELGRLLGTTPVHDVAGRLAPDTRPPPPIDALVEATLASRPALAAEERRYHQREEIVRLEHARAWPWFRFTAIPRYRADGSDVHTRDFAAGIELTVPLLNLNGGPIQIAEATRDQEREVFAKLAGGIRRDLAGARDDIALRAETLRRYETEVLPGLDAQDKLLSTAVAGGQIDVVALTAAEGLILRQRATYVDMRLACYRAWLVLDRTAGRRYSGGGV
jgi:outer membrane protein TolC